MDLTFSSDEERFRERVQKFLRENLPAGWGKGSGRPPGVSQFDFLKDWQRRLYDNGFLGMAWPKEYGGQGASQVEMAIFNEEVARFRAPGPLNVLGGIPTINLDYSPLWRVFPTKWTNAAIEHGYRSRLTDAIHIADFQAKGSSPASMTKNSGPWASSSIVRLSIASIDRQPPDSGRAGPARIAFRAGPSGSRMRAPRHTALT